jgi:excisionase family DNA binding protein
MGVCETVGVSEAARRLGISRGVAYRLANEGRLPCLRLGKRLVVPKVALERMLREPQRLSMGSAKESRSE